MSKKIIFFTTILIVGSVIFLVGGGYYLSKELAFPEIEKCKKFSFWLKSGAVQSTFFINGLVKEISNRTLTIVAFTKTGKKGLVLKFPIGQNVSIVASYILPEEASEKEVKNKITIRGGKEYKLGKRESKFEDIKVGDIVFLRLALRPDYTLEVVSVQIGPPDLLPTRE